MDILNSEWLLHMLEKSARTPQARLLSLFDILDDWLNAPKVDSQINLENTQHSHVLQNYLSLEAAKAGAAMPEMLASQLYFMAIAAANEKVHGNPASFNHAKLAAKALISAQTKREFHISRKIVYASAASFIAISLLIGSLLFFNNLSPTQQSTLANASMQSPPYIMPALANPNNTLNIASPEQTAALFAKVDQMRKGNCQLVEALQLPDNYKKVYFENVVLGQISTNPEEQRLANQLLDMVKCNYTPMLMANSKN
ncbi:MAG: hypothetical protein SFU55_07020 [Methylophilus sp.]|nr:hypothetical protein [Methylophilus sp.]